MQYIFGLATFITNLVTFAWIPAPARPFFVVSGLIALIYVFYVRPKIAEFRAVTGILDKVDAEGYSWWRSLLARLSGFKTVILGALAALFPQLPAILDEINGFTGWNLFLASGTADKVAAGLAAATAITHVAGLVSAAKAIPVDAIPAAPVAPTAAPVPAASLGAAKP